MNQEQIRFDRDLNDYLEKNFGGKNPCSCNINITENIDGDKIVIINNKEPKEPLDLYDFEFGIYICPDCNLEIKEKRL